MVHVNKITSQIGTRHVQALLFCLGNSLTFMFRTSMSVAIIAMTDTTSNNPDIRTLDWDSWKQSLILSSTLWGTLATQIPTAYFMRGGGNHKFFLYSTFICSIIDLLMPTLAIHFGWISVLCARILTGVSQGCVTPCLSGLLSKWAPPNERALLGSFVVNGQQLGNILSMLLAGLIAGSSLGWPGIFYIFGSMGILWSMFFFWMGAEKPADHNTISSQEKEYIEKSLGQLDRHYNKKDYIFPWKSIIKSLPVWSLLISNCLEIWSYYMLLTKLPSYLKHVLNYDIKESGILSSLPYLVKWLLVLPIGWLSDFALRKGAPITLIRKICGVFGMWGPSATLLVLCLVKPSDPTIVIVIFVLAIGMNAATVCAQQINVLDLTPNFSGLLSSIINFFGKIFGMLAPIACGIIVTDQTNVNQWYVIFYISVVLYFIGNVPFLIFGSAEVQPWNELSKKRSEDREDNKASVIT